MEMNFVWVTVFSSLLFFIMGLGTTMTVSARRARAVKTPTTPNVSGDPYRTPAERPIPDRVFESFKENKQPKPKREFKMNLTVLQRKVLHSFLWLVPVLGAIVAIGILYDLSIPGVGVRVACGFAAGIVGAFCFIMCLHTATDGFSG